MIMTAAKFGKVKSFFGSAVGIADILLFGLLREIDDLYHELSGKAAEEQEEQIKRIDEKDAAQNIYPWDFSLGRYTIYCSSIPLSNEYRHVSSFDDLGEAMAE